MTLFEIVLFLHIAFALLLVGGSIWTHVAHDHALRARTVDGARTTAAYVAAFDRLGGPLAGGTFLAGATLAFLADRWTDAWLLVSLALFATAGAIFVRVLQPASTRLLERLTAEPDGPMTSDLVASLRDPRQDFLLSTLGGVDFAILLLMVTKPGLVASLAVAVAGAGLGALIGARGNRRHAAPSPSMPPAAAGTP